MKVGTPTNTILPPNNIHTLFDFWYYRFARRFYQYTPKGRRSKRRPIQSWILELKQSSSIIHVIDDDDGGGGDDYYYIHPQWHTYEVYTYFQNILFS
jgi:hypothetical protein